MQFEGYPIEKWRAQFMGAIEVNEAEGLAMKTDRVVVMVVATRIRKSPIEVSDEEGIAMITRQNRIEHLAVLEGDLREKALSLLAQGSERGFQESLLARLEGVDPETGEIQTAGYAHVARDEDEFVVTPPTPATLVEDEEMEMDTHPMAHTSGQDTDYVALDDPDLVPDEDTPPPRDEPEYFDVPPIKDTSQPVGTGPVKQHGPVTNGSGGDGFKVAPVTVDDLAAVGATGAPTPDPAAPPVGEVVGNVRPHGRKDKELEAFFNEEIEVDPT